MICWICTLSPMFKAQGSPSRKTETCPFSVMTWAAASFESESGWAEHTIPVMATNSPATTPATPVRYIKKYIGLADASLQYYAAFRYPKLPKRLRTQSTIKSAQQEDILMVSLWKTGLDSEVLEGQKGETGYNKTRSMCRRATIRLVIAASIL